MISETISSTLHPIYGYIIVGSWSAPADCVVNIAGYINVDKGYCSIAGMSYVYGTTSTSAMFSITGEPIKAGQSVEIRGGSVRIAGFTV